MGGASVLDELRHYVDPHRIGGQRAQMSRQVAGPAPHVEHGAGTDKVPGNGRQVIGVSLGGVPEQFDVLLRHNPVRLPNVFDRRTLRAVLKAPDCPGPEPAFGGSRWVLRS
jgi:hypothetical protein